MMEKNAKIYVAGHRGLAGSALVRALQENGYTNLLMRTHSELDLTNPNQTAEFFKNEKPEYVFLAAAKVGGIHANDTYPADFIYQNLAIQTNIIHNSYLVGTKRLLFLGSACIYPRICPQPIKEEYFMTGPLEPTNEPYAVAKIAGMSMCNAYNRQYGTQFMAVMPANLYGPNDHFDLENSHVLPALIRKFHEAKMEKKPNVVAWGTGSAIRDFMHVDDLANACLFLMNMEGTPGLLNIGTGKGTSIKELTSTIKEIVDFKGELVWDTTKPDGMPERYLDVTKIHSLGWHHKVDLAQGIKDTYAWYVQNQSHLR